MSTTTAFSAVNKRDSEVYESLQMVSLHPEDSSPGVCGGGVNHACTGLDLPRHMIITVCGGVTSRELGTNTHVELLSSTAAYHYQVPSRGNLGTVHGVRVVLVFLSGTLALHSFLARVSAWARTSSETTTVL